MTNFNIEVVSDSVCPWCYVGKQKMDQAIKAYKERYPESNDEFSITWSPFFLNPGAPKKSIDKRAYYLTRFGEERSNMMRDRMTQVGADAGINFKFGGRTGNTRDSHRLIHLGKLKSPTMQTRVVEELFSSYFENEGDITSHEVLRDAGVRAGLDEEEVEDWLRSGKGGEAVDREVEEVKRNQITGVPTFTIQSKYEIGGAQDAAVFLRLFEKIKATEQSARV